MKKSKNTVLLFRAQLLGLLVLLLGFGILFKTFHIQFWEAVKYQKNFEGRILRDQPIEATRGSIWGQKKRLLAADIPYYDLHLDATAPFLLKLKKNKLLKDSLELLNKGLQEIFGVEKNYSEKIQNGLQEKNRFLPLQKNITYQQYQKLKALPLLFKGKNKTGFIFVERKKRYLPQGELAKRTIGYVQEEGASVGLERSFFDILSGKKGIQQQKRIGNGHWIPLSDNYLQDPEKGADITTTLDMDMQELVHQSLSEQLQKNNAQSGLAIVMEVQTGYIRAISNLSRKEEGVYLEDYNYAVGGYYEPGSTFKMAALLAVLENGQNTIEDSVNTSPGIWQPYKDFEMRESKKEGYGKIPLAEALAYSSNIAIGQLVWQNFNKKPADFLERLQQFGLFDKTDIELLGEKKPYFNQPGSKFWSGVSLVQMSIGYEVLLSPIQILSFYNTIANNGKKMQLRLVEKIHYSNGKTEVFYPKVLKQKIADAKNIAQVQKVLEKVVLIGTAKHIKNPYFEIAGKTGTAQVLQTDKKTYKDQSGKANYYSSFVGYFPANAPKYSILVAVSEPSKGYYSSEVAAPIFKQIAYSIYKNHYFFEESTPTPSDHFPYSMRAKMSDLKQIYKSLGLSIVPENRESIFAKVHIDQESIQLSPLEYAQNEKIPDFTHFNLKDAVFWAQSLGLKVEIIGDLGYIRRQSLPAGTAFKKNQTIVFTVF